MDNRTSHIGRDKRVPPKHGFGKRVPPCFSRKANRNWPLRRRATVNKPVCKETQTQTAKLGLFARFVLILGFNKELAQVNPPALFFFKQLDSPF